MDKIKVLFQHTLMISTGILFMIAVEGIVCHLMGKDILFLWYHPMSILLTGFLGALITRILFYKKELTMRQFLIRLVCHCLFLFFLVSLLGYLFTWYESLWEYLFVVFAFLIIYIFVWLASIWLFQWDINKINRALKEIQDEE